MSHKRPFIPVDDDFPSIPSYPISETIDTLFELNFPEDVLDTILLFMKKEPQWFNLGYSYMFHSRRLELEYNDIMKYQAFITFFVLVGVKIEYQLGAYDGESEAFNDSRKYTFTYYIRGPPHSPYEHGWYKILLILDGEHPMSAPIVKVENPELLIHPDLDENGIWDIEEDYSPSFTMEKLLLTFISTMNSGLDEFHPSTSFLHTHAKLCARNREIRRRAKYTFWLG